MRKACSVEGLQYFCRSCRQKYAIEFDDERLTREGSLDVSAEERFEVQRRAPPGLCRSCRPKVAAAFIQTAHQNYGAARHLASASFPAETTYLAAQSAEKAIKAVLVLERGQIAFGHDVNAIDVRPIIPYVPQEVWCSFTVVEPAADFLARLAGPRQERPRYPEIRAHEGLWSPSSIPQAETEHALMAAQSICVTCYDLLKTRVRQLHTRRVSVSVVIPQRKAEVLSDAASVILDLDLSFA